MKLIKCSCGGKAQLSERDSPLDGVLFSYECSKCERQSGAFDFLDDSKISWNILILKEKIVTKAKEICASLNENPEGGGLQGSEFTDLVSATDELIKYEKMGEL
jgi:hypothetical protein